jgi:ArsR family transcriptional regulator
LPRIRENYRWRRLRNQRYFDNNRRKARSVTATEDSLGTDDLAAVFKALADANRLAIFELVCDRAGEGRTTQETARSVSRIADAFDLTLSTVSHHLKELRRAGLIRCEKVGQTVYCTPNPETLAQIERFAGGARTRARS